MTDTQRKVWLEQRRQGITATDIARLVCPWGSRPEAAMIYAEKMGHQSEDADPLLLLGLATEDVNAELSTRRTGVQLSKPGLIVDPVEPWKIATLDRADERFWPWELKYTSRYFDEKQWGEEYTDSVPPRYTIQETWQMMIAKTQPLWVPPTEGEGNYHGHLSAMAPSGEVRIYRIGYDEEFVAMLVEIARAMWNFVECLKPPPEYWQHPLAEAVSEKCFRLKTGKHLICDAETAALVAKYDEYRDIAKVAEKKKEVTRDAILARIGDTETASAGNYSLKRRFVAEGVVSAHTRKSYWTLDIRAKKGS